MPNPKVRFKREDGMVFPEWEERNLLYCFEVRDEKQTPTEEAPLMAFIAYKGVVDKGDRYDRSYLVKTDNKKYKRTEYNDFIYSSNNLDVGSIGLNKYGTAVISVVYEIFSVKSTVIPDFINALVQRPENIYKIIQYRQGCLYGQYKIFAEDFLSVTVNIPCLEEQQKIADFLSAIDEVIAQTEVEVQNLEQQKKAAMQGIFSQKVRFKRDNGTEFPEWERKALQDISRYVTTTGKGTKTFYVGTENMQKGCAGVTFENDTEVAVRGITYSPSDILVSNIRPYLQKAWKADRKGICSTDVLCIRGHNNIDNDFLYTVIASDYFFDYVMQGAKGTKMPRGDKKHIMNMPFRIPCLEEQQKIADFLSTFDDAITYAKQELEKWKELKKGLLQKMFV